MKGMRLIRTKNEKEGKKQSAKSYLKNNWQLYVMILPAVIYFVIFNYLPMYGIQIAFKDYKAVLGINGSEWVGFKHFITFFNAYYFARLLINTLVLNLENLIISFPVPIIMAIMLNQIRNDKIKRGIQTSIYVPYFISTVVLAGMLYIFLSPTGGIFNTVRGWFGLKTVDFMSSASAFRPIYILSGIWQGAGYSTILFIAALSGVDQALYEAAEIDGASIWQKIRYIDFPSLLPTIMMVLVLDCGKLLGSNTEKALVLQTAGNIPTSDIIGVYVYNVGLGSGQFSYTAAIGLFINVINFIMIITVNKISRRTTEVGLF
jgi:putative aldouronate transport system permease protein